MCAVGGNFPPSPHHRQNLKELKRFFLKDAQACLKPRVNPETTLTRR